MEVLREIYYPQRQEAYIRVKVWLIDGGTLEVSEYVSVEEEKVRVIRYNFHWQDAQGQLIKRWDNAKHHPELETYPHHVHVGKLAKPHPHTAVSFEEVMRLIEAELLG